MKLLMKLMLAGLVLAMLLPFTILKNEQGNSLMSFSDLKMPDLKIPEFDMPEFADLPSTENLVPSSGEPAAMDVFYKWHDGEGNVHFTTEPPAEGIDYSTKEFNPDANVIQAVEVQEQEVIAQEPEKPAAGEVSAISEASTPYDAEQIKKLFEDTENIEKLLQQRSENQKSALN